MKISLPAKGNIGVEITDLDSMRITAVEVQEIRKLVYAHKLVVFRSQQPDKEQYISFAKLFGVPQIYLQPNYHHPEHPEIFVSSNVKEEGRKVGVAGTGQYWHTDYQFHPEPLPMTMLYPQILPKSKRETCYIDMAKVYEELPQHLSKAVNDKRAIHDAKWRYKITADDIDRSITDILAEVEKMVPPTVHPAVIRHPITNELILYVSRGFTVGIEGLSHEENAALMSELFDFVECEEHIHIHPWQAGDILLWDNRSLLHKASATPEGEQSSSYRIGIYDQIPFYGSSSAGSEELSGEKLSHAMA